MSSVPAMAEVHGVCLCGIATLLPAIMVEQLLLGSVPVWWLFCQFSVFYVAWGQFIRRAP